MPQPLRIVLIHDPGSGYCRDVLEGVFNYARPSKHWLFRSSRQDHAVLPLIRSWDTDGIIAQVTSPHFATALNEMGIPVVNVSSSLADSGLHQVCVDDWKVGAMAATHLLERGLQQFAYFGYDVAGYPLGRRMGFRDIVLQHDMPYTELLYEHRPTTATSPHDWRNWDDEIRRWVQSLPKPCGLMALHDVAAVDLVGLSREADILIPDDLAIIGVDDDSLLCRQAYPPLSSIRTPGEQIGYRAAEILDRLLQGEDLPVTIERIDPTGIATRQSTDILAIEDPEVARALRFIREHAEHCMRVDDVLKHVDMNRRTLERRFRSLLGRSPLQEIRRVHIERAKQLLIDTDLPTPDVAARSGFANASRLAIIFKQETGMKPTEYRNRYRRR